MEVRACHDGVVECDRAEKDAAGLVEGVTCVLVEERTRAESACRGYAAATDIMRARGEESRERKEGCDACNFAVCSTKGKK